MQISSVVGLGALLFGYHIGYSSPTEDQIKLQANLSATDADLMFSLISIGACFGSLGASRVADFIGRRTALALLSVPFTAGSLFFAFLVNMTGIVLF